MATGSTAYEMDSSVRLCHVDLCQTQHSTAQAILPKKWDSSVPPSMLIYISSAQLRSAQHSTAQSASPVIPRHSTAQHSTAPAASPVIPQVTLPTSPRPPSAKPESLSEMSDDIPCQGCGVEGALAHTQSRTTCIACRAGCWPGPHPW